MTLDCDIAVFEGKSASEHLNKRKNEGHYIHLTQEQYEAQALLLLQSRLSQFFV